MALIFNEKYYFFHIPKCGGTSIRQVLYASTKSCIEYNHPHAEPFWLNPSLSKLKNSFVVIREPVSWYHSYFSYRQIKGWKSEHYLDQSCRADSFEEFCKNVIKRSPNGYVTDTYCRFIFGVEYVLKLEDIGTELPKLLSIWGIKMDFNVPKLNTKGKQEYPLTRKTKDALIATDKYIYKIFQYAHN